MRALCSVALFGLLASVGCAQVPGPSVKPAARAAPTPAPNVIVILVDDLGWPDVSAYGPSAVATPNIDRIAKTGAAFTNGYVAASVCAVSRAGLLTGRTPQSFGFTYNLDDKRNLADGLPLSEQTMADRLKGLGYHTAAIGKWHQGFSPAYYPTRRGFDEFYGFIAGESVYIDPKTPGFVTTMTGTNKDDLPISERKGNGAIVEGADARPVDNFDKYLTTELTNRAIDYVDRQSRAREPFFLYLAYNAPHWPLQAPKANYDRLADIKDPVRRTYLAMISALDDDVGRLLDAVERDGVRENTLVVFLSDNGCPAQLRFCDVSQALGAGKFTYLEGGSRVPFLMSWPSRLSAGRVIDAPVSAMDVLPTVLKAAAPGRPLPSGLDGRDLLETAADRSTAAQERMMFFGQAPVFAVRQGRWKVWKSLDHHQVKLFDLQADPFERTDVSAAHPEILHRLETALDAWRAKLPAPLWPLKSTAMVRIGDRQTESVN
jgi:arylsulfatase A-like enzyme